MASSMDLPRMSALILLRSPSKVARKMLNLLHPPPRAGGIELIRDYGNIDGH